MVIRTEQIELFDELAERTFQRQLASYIRQKHNDTIVRLEDGILPLREIADKTLEAMVRGCLTRARGHGIAWRSALASFVVVMFIIAPNFDDDPLVHELLSDEDIEPDYRMDSLCERLNQEQWDALRRRYDTASWSFEDA